MAGETYGKVQTTFQLLTEETAIKWSFNFDADATQTAPDTWNAGDIMTFDGATTGEVQQATVSSLQALGVAMETYTTSLNETANGKVTVIVGPHIGKTKQIDSSITTSLVPGTLLYPSNVTAGRFGTAGATGAKPVAMALDYDGTWLTYLWIGEYVTTAL